MDGWMDSNKRASSFVINRLARNDVITLFFFFFCNYSILDSIFSFFFIFRLEEEARIYLFIYYFPRFDDRSNSYYNLLYLRILFRQLH